MATSDFAANLRALCDRERSISFICRELGINRQQFGKYLSGKSTPSAFNLVRIGQYFRVDPSDFSLPSDEFAERMLARPNGPDANGGQGARLAFADAFLNQATPLSRYIGYYQVYTFTPSWKGHVMNFLTHVFERDGLVWAKSVHRFYDPESKTTYLCKYVGNACLLHDRIFVIQYPPVTSDVVVETIIKPTLRGRLSILQGLTFSIAFKTRQPFTSPVALEYLGTTIDIKKHLGRAGVIPVGSGLIKPSVLQALGPEPDFPQPEPDGIRL